MGVSNPFPPPATDPPADVLAECRACPRLVAWREAQAAAVPPRCRHHVQRHGFWARPVAAFGDARAWLAIVGLAPAGQGANRTGRMFTGDRSGDFLFAALHRAGMASVPTSEHRGDDLFLEGVLITAALRCAPPGNRPAADELRRCRWYLQRDLSDLRDLRVVLALGRIAHDAVLAVAGTGRGRPGGKPAFVHGHTSRLAERLWLVDSYHVSQQNTFTGRLTPAMFDAILESCRELGGHGGPRTDATTPQ